MIWRKKLKITIINKEFDILISKKGSTETIYKRLEKALDYIKNNSIDFNGGIYVTVDSLIEINNTITDSNNITLRKLM